MKKLTLKSSLLAAVLAGAANVSATDITAGITFTTLPAITMTEIRSLSFGNSLYLTNGAFCTMDQATGTETMTATQVGSTTRVGDFDNIGALTGTCDTAVNGVAGIYEVSSATDANISITISQGTATEVSFLPTGYTVEYTGDTLVTIPEGVATATVASGTADASDIVTGRNRIIVVGTLSNTQALSAGQSYATDFNIDVVYN